MQGRRRARWYRAGTRQARRVRLPRGIVRGSHASAVHHKAAARQICGSQPQHLQLAPPTRTYEGFADCGGTGKLRQDRGDKLRTATQVGAKAKGSAAASWVASWAARPRLSHAGVLGSPCLPFCRAASLDRRRHTDHGASQGVRTLRGPSPTPRWRANCCTRRVMHQNVRRVMSSQPIL